MPKQLKSAVDDEIGVCTLCGELVHFFRRKSQRDSDVKMFVETRRVRHAWQTAGDLLGLEERNCPVCGGVTVFPAADQQHLVAVFLIGGWDSVTAGMFSDPQVRALMTAREETAAAAAAVRDDGCE